MDDTRGLDTGTSSWAEPIRGSGELRQSESLLDTLLAEESLQKDFVMPDETYRVITRISVQPASWLFRTAVTADGREMEIEPFQPIFRDLTSELDSLPDHKARLTVARRALEAHLGRCEQVSNRLRTSTRLVKSGESLWRSRGLVGAGVLGLCLLGFGVFRGLDPSSSESVLHEVTEPRRPTVPSIPENLEAEQPMTETPATTQVEVVVDEGEPDAEERRPMGEGSHASTEVRSLEPSGSEDPGPEHAVSAPTSHSGAIREPRVAPSPASPPAPPPEPVTRARVEPSSRGPFRETIRVEPAGALRVRVLVGSSIYGDDATRFTVVPERLDGAICITFPKSRWEQFQGMLLNLEHSTPLVILHDANIKKVPEWLESFRASGEVLEGLDLETGRVLRFNLYQRRHVTGVVALGANTGGARWSRNLLKRRVLYLVCIPGGG